MIKMMLLFGSWMVVLNVSQAARVLYPAHGPESGWNRWNPWVKSSAAEIGWKPQGLQLQVLKKAQRGHGPSLYTHHLQRSNGGRYDVLLPLMGYASSSLRLKMYISHREERIHQVAKAELPVTETFLRFIQEILLKTLLLFPSSILCPQVLESYKWRSEDGTVENFTGASSLQRPGSRGARQACLQGPSLGMICMSCYVFFHGNMGWLTGTVLLLPCG